MDIAEKVYSGRVEVGGGGLFTKGQERKQVRSAADGTMRKVCICLRV